jgi:hypothetical protein
MQIEADAAYTVVCHGGEQRFLKCVPRQRIIGLRVLLRVLRLVKNLVPVAIGLLFPAPDNPSPMVPKRGKRSKIAESICIF